MCSIRAEAASPDCGRAFDCGTTAAEIEQCTFVANATYHATGPASVTTAQIAEIMSRVTEKRVAFSPITIDQVEAGLAAAGLPPAIVKVISRFQRAVQNGVFDLITCDVERLAGRRAESLEDFLMRSLRQGAAQAGHS